MRRATLILLFFACSLGFCEACSSAPKKTPELSKMEGRKVALIEIDGPSTAKTVVETALVNQLIQHGSFILISKQDVDAARLKPTTGSDPKSIAREAGADYLLVAKVMRFDADTREGYSSEEIEDPQLKEETGEGKTQHLYKVKSLTGDVAIQLEFTELKTGDTRIGIAEDHDQTTAEERSSAAHLPPKLRFLENLSNKAFRKFFDRYN